MKTGIRVKICGLTTPEAVAAAAEGGAAYVGFVFFPRSPRNIGIEQARELALEVRPGIAKVALTVDADDALIDSINSRVPLDMFIVPLMEKGKVAALAVHAGVWTSAALAAPVRAVPRLRGDPAECVVVAGFCG